MNRFHNLVRAGVADRNMGGWHNASDHALDWIVPCLIRFRQPSRRRRFIRQTRHRNRVRDCRTRENTLVKKSHNPHRAHFNNHSMLPDRRIGVSKASRNRNRIGRLRLLGGGIANSRVVPGPYGVRRRRSWRGSRLPGRDDSASCIGVVLGPPCRSKSEQNDQRDEKRAHLNSSAVRITESNA
jgi:hypothetical protein